jgi:hypothetical protein
MQLDPGFAARLRAREPDAEHSTGLGEGELACLRAADPVALSADRAGRRRSQLLRNISGELELSLSAAREPEWLDEFPASVWFHRAIARDQSLPLALAAHLTERAAPGPASLGALVALETALARARREQRALPECPTAALVLGPRAWLVELADGTLAWASALREALDRGSAPPEPPRGRPAGSTETVLIVSEPLPHAGARLLPVRAERLEPAVAAFLGACSEGLDEAGIDAFCRARRIDRAAADALIQEFIGEGVLLRGPAARPAH